MTNTAQDKTECCICHKTPSQVLYYFRTSQVNSALTDLLFCVGVLSVTMDLECNVYKQVENGVKNL